LHSSGGGGFVHYGNTEALAATKMLTVQNKVVELQLPVNSFDDIFLLMAVMVAMIIIPALPIK
jgi:hypothetical protein